MCHRRLDLCPRLLFSALSPREPYPAAVVCPGTHTALCAHPCWRNFDSSTSCPLQLSSSATMQATVGNLCASEAAGPPRGHLLMLMRVYR